MAYPNDLEGMGAPDETEMLLQEVRKGIKYLAFEGGGGRGAAYVGAMKALRECEIITYRIDDKKRTKRLDDTRILGISGTSAGAIMACLLAAGYDDSELHEILSSGETANLYDNADVYGVPVLGVSKQAISPLRILKNDIGTISAIGTSLAKSAATVTMTAASIKLIVELAKPHISGRLLKQLAANYEVYLESLVWDAGLFDGMYLRDFIDKKLYRKFGVWNISLEKFYEQTKINLRLAAVCLNTKEQVWFDHEGPWRKMAVADAVRISAGFPFAFKPVAVPFEYQEDPKAVILSECFLFVDGGILNNLPIHAFDDEGVKRRTLTKVEAMLFGGTMFMPYEVPKFNQQVLGLRLTEPAARPSPIANVFEMAFGVLDSLQTPAEAFQVRSMIEKDQTVDLDTTGLSLLEFAVSAGTLYTVEERTRRQTLDWITFKLQQTASRLRRPDLPPERPPSP